MAFFRRKVRKFTSPDSFRLFMKGIRSLQLHDEEAAKDRPDRIVLEELLSETGRQFQDCVSLYPKDLLPRYYLGIVLGIKAQNENALYFKALADDRKFHRFNGVPLLPKKVSEFLQRSADEFGETARRAGGGDLRSYALYNQAQALARMDEELLEAEKKVPRETTWKRAEEILLNISPNLLDKLPLYKWVILRLPHIFFAFVDELAKLAGNLGDRVEDVPGIAASVADAAAENEALKLQIELSYLFIKLRAAIHRPPEKHRESKRDNSPLSSVDSIIAAVAWPFENIQVGRLGGKKSAPQKEGLEEITAALLDLITTIKKKKLPDRNKLPIVADYWNKSAFITWERALFAPKGFPEETEKYLKRAQEYLDQVTERLWTPRQMNEVRLALAQGRKREASKVLQQILGVPKPQAPPQEQSEETGAIAEMIERMATTPDAIAIASNLRRSYPKMPAETIKKITSLLAGKIPAALLDQIFRQYSGAQ